VKALTKVLSFAAGKSVGLSAASNMKTAMVRVFSVLVDVDMSQSVVLRLAMKSYTLSNLPKKEALHLDWSIDQLLNYVSSLSPFVELDYNQLTDVTIVLCMVFTTLRFTELMTVNVFETDPDETSGTWKLWTQVKGHNCKESVLVHAVDEVKLNPIAALLDMRRRVKQLKGGQSMTTCWYSMVQGVLTPLSYNEMRLAATRVMKAAGISDNRPYHIKHAVLTCLDSEGASRRDIAAFARHRPESMAAYKHYISYDGGKASVQKLIESYRRGDKQ
jgi:integrase